MSGKPLVLNERLDRAGQHIARARLFFELWFYFEGADTRPGIMETMEDYTEFFRFTPHAYLVAYTIYIAGVFDRRRDTISLPRLVGEMRNALTFAQRQEAGALLAQAEPLVSKITILRHKAFAHRTAGMSYDDVFSLAAIKHTQMRELTDISLKTVNLLLASAGLREQIFNDLPRESAEAMMKALATRAR